MAEGEEVFAIRALKRKFETCGNGVYLPDAGQLRRAHRAMRNPAKSAILMDHSIGMGVSELRGGAEEKKTGEQDHA